MFQEAISLYFKDAEGLDFQITQNEGELVISMGYEPAYQFEKLKVIRISTDKYSSYIQTGIAWGDYGSKVASKTKYYSQYKNKSKFVRFVDRWQLKLTRFLDLSIVKGQWRVDDLGKIYQILDIAPDANDIMGHPIRYYGDLTGTWFYREWQIRQHAVITDPETIKQLENGIYKPRRIRSNS